MSFFNNKEDVMHVELTPYGRYLLSEGKFQPVYYEFCDEEIIYDNDHAGTSEEQKDAQNRLKNQFIKMKESVNVLSCDIAKSKDYSLIDYSNKHSVLGSSTISSKYAPAFTIHMLNGEIESLTQNSNDGSENWPQLELATGSFEIRTQNSGNDYFNDETVSDTFDDGSFLRVFDDYLFIEFIEKNTEDLMRNFELQLFEIKYDSKGNENLYQLDPNDEKYFEIFIDHEIDSEYYCKHKPNDRTDNFYYNTSQKCKKKISKDIFKPYDNISQKDTEKC